MTGLLKATNDELQRSRMAHELAIASAQAKEMINTCDNSEDKRVFQQALVTSQLQRYIALNQLNTHKKVDEDKGEETLKIAGAGSGLLSMHDMLPMSSAVGKTSTGTSACTSCNSSNGMHLGCS
jgi:hypothetical protein